MGGGGNVHWRHSEPIDKIGDSRCVYNVTLARKLESSSNNCNNLQHDV